MKILNLSKDFLLTFCIVLLFLFNGNAQVITGTILQEDSYLPASGVIVGILGDSPESVTDQAGKFRFENITVNQGELIIVGDFRYENFRIPFNLSGNTSIDLGTIKLESDISDADDVIDVISLSDDELADDEGGAEFSSILGASRDVFLNTAAFKFSVARFRQRGYKNTFQILNLNGAPMNDLDDGGLAWSTWGGLNDVLRNRDNILAMNAGEFSFGGMLGASNIDLRASNQRKQTRLSIAAANRTYKHRIMLTHSTGWMKGDWAISTSISRRWGDEAFIEGTTYDIYAGFFGVEKRLGNHTLGLTAFVAPGTRGRSTASVQEMNDLADDNYYNSYWGYENGEKRNSREYRSNQPVIILRHDVDFSDKLQLTTSVFTQFGTFGSTRIDWFEAADPRPDYYRRLPSFIEDEVLAEQVAEALRTYKSRRQIDWDAMRLANSRNLVTIENVDGIEGNNVTGLRSNYVLEEQHYDNHKLGFNSVFNYLPNDFLKVSGGLSYLKAKVKNYKILDDLLGGDFYVNLDQFALRDFPNNPDIIQNDIDNPNGLVREGDIFGFNYDINDTKADIWIQPYFTFPKFEFFVGANLSRSEFWRTGYMRNGKFPDSSAGDSEKQKFTNYAAKAGFTYKIDGRNYLYTNGLLQTRAPFSRQSFLSPRTRHQVVANLQKEKVKSVELGYVTRYQGVKGRLTGYYSIINDGTETTSFYDDQERNFVNYTLENVDIQSHGVEFALEANISQTLSVNAVAAVGESFYTDRFIATTTQDNVAETLRENQLIYSDNFKVEGTPQQAYSFGFNYNSPNYWFASLSFNYFRQSYLDFNPLRRTPEAVNSVVKDEFPELWNEIVAQEELDANYTVDLFAGKSFKFGDYFIYLNLGVNNLLNNRTFITGGYEQSRFDFENDDPTVFPNRRFYAFGTNYFVSISFKM